MREFDFTGFTAVETGYGIDIKVVQSPSYKVTLFADPAAMKKIEVEASGRTLTIRRSRNFYLPPWTFHWKAHVEISMPTLEEVSASGGSRADVAMNGSGSIIVKLSGGSALSGSITAGTLEIHGSGGSSAELTGGSTLLRLSGSGGSRYRMVRFPAKTLDADLSGGSSVESTVSDSLSVRGSGGSHVVYRGTARVDRQELSGGSWVRKE